MVASRRSTPPPSSNNGKKSKRKAREVRRSTANTETDIENSRSQPTDAVPSKEGRIPGGRPVRQVKRLGKRTPASARMVGYLLEADARRDMTTIRKLVSATRCSRPYPDQAKYICKWNEESDSMNVASPLPPGPKLNSMLSQLEKWEKGVENMHKEMGMAKKEFDQGFRLVEGLDHAEEIAIKAHSKARLLLLKRWSATQAAALIAEKALKKALKVLEKELSRGQFYPEFKIGKIETHVYCTAKTLVAHQNKLMTLRKNKQAILKALKAHGGKVVDVNKNGIRTDDERWGTGGDTIQAHDVEEAHTIVNGHNIGQKVNVNSSSSRNRKEEDIPYDGKAVNAIVNSMSEMHHAGSELPESLDPSRGFVTGKDLCNYWKLLENDFELEKNMCFAVVKQMCPNVNDLLNNILKDRAGLVVDGVDLRGTDAAIFDINYALEVLGAPSSGLQPPPTSTSNEKPKTLDGCAATSIDMLKSDAADDEVNFSKLKMKCEALYDDLSSKILEQKKERQLLSATLKDLSSRSKRLRELCMAIEEENDTVEHGRTSPCPSMDSMF